MVQANDVVAYSKSLVGKKVTVPTNRYGGQCVALIDHIVQHFSDKDLAYTNAKDGLTKAKKQGLEVIYNDGSPELIPQAGDFFVCQWGAGDPFGHIGVVVSADQNGMTTIEQNIDGYRDDNHNGINDQLEEDGGGYTRNHSRNYEGVIGWFRLPYEEPKEEKKENEVKYMIDTAYAIRLLEDLGNRKAGEIYLVNVGARTFKLQNKDTWNTIKDVFPEIKVLQATPAVNYLHASINAWGLTEEK